jgi:hypothetical protein
MLIWIGMSEKFFILPWPRRLRTNRLNGTCKRPEANAGQNLVVVADLTLGAKIKNSAPHLVPQGCEERPMPGNADLRRALDAACKLRVVSEYRDRIAALQTQYGHAISILQDGKERMERFNCFAYALGIWPHQTYIDLVDATNDSAVIDSEFVRHLVDAGALVEVAPAKAAEGDMVIYFHKDQPTHAAIVVSLSEPITLRSKWGGNEIHQHNLWEVPACYGGRVRIYRQIDPADTLRRVGRQFPRRAIARAGPQ